MYNLFFVRYGHYVRKKQYTLNKSSKWYIVYICRVLQKGLIAHEFYP